MIFWPFAMKKNEETISRKRKSFHESVGNLLKSMGGSANTREIFEKMWEIFGKIWEIFKKTWEVFEKEEESWYVGEREKRENQGLCDNG